MWSFICALTLASQLQGREAGLASCITVPDDQLPRSPTLRNVTFSTAGPESCG